jgi:hypothetical protein
MSVIGTAANGGVADDQTMRSVADAVRDASKTATEHATAVQNAIVGTGLIQTVSRISYTGAYAISFGIVYTAVFVTQWLPQDNPVMDGFSDGARAAMDWLKAN